MIELSREHILTCFKEIGMIGKGKNGVVIAVKDLFKNKMYSRKGFSDLKWFNREFLFSRLLKHPNLLKMKYQYASNYQSFYKYAPFSYSEVYPDCFEEFSHKYLICILLGLDYIHGNNMIHRDIKEANTLLFENFHVVISDLESLTFPAKPSLKNLVSTAGTLEYIRQEPHNDFSDDIFSVSYMMKKKLKLQPNDDVFVVKNSYGFNDSRTILKDLIQKPIFGKYIRIMVLQIMLCFYKQLMYANSIRNEKRKVSYQYFIESIGFWEKCRDLYPSLNKLPKEEFVKRLKEQDIYSKIESKIIEIYNKESKNEWKTLFEHYSDETKLLMNEQNEMFLNDSNNTIIEYLRFFFLIFDTVYPKHRIPDVIIAIDLTMNSFPLNIRDFIESSLPSSLKTISSSLQYIHGFFKEFQSETNFFFEILDNNNFSFEKSKDYFLKDVAIQYHRLRTQKEVFPINSTIPSFILNELKKDPKYTFLINNMMSTKSVYQASLDDFFNDLEKYNNKINHL